MSQISLLIYSNVMKVDNIRHEMHGGSVVKEAYEGVGSSALWELNSVNNYKIYPSLNSILSRLSSCTLPVGYVFSTNTPSPFVSE